MPVTSCKSEESVEVATPPFAIFEGRKSRRTKVETFKVELPTSTPPVFGWPAVQPHSPDSLS